MKTIAFFNIKGGVGKTTSAIQFAAELAQKSNRILFVDLDMQGNSSRFFGAYDKSAPCVAQLLTGKVQLTDVIKPTRFSSLDILPANMSLITTDKELMLDTMLPQQTRLKLAMSLAENDYDYCVIDCPTYLTLAMINALVAADSVVVPTDIDEQAFEGLSYVLETIREVTPLNPTLQFAGCLVTKYSPKSEFSRTGLEALSQNVKVFKTKIRLSTRMTESIAQRRTIAEYSPRSLATKNYRDFAEELANG